MLRRFHDDEQGIALITILGLSLVLALLVTALLQYGVGSMSQARHDQDWQAAYAAAEAGVDDFLARINRDIAYWQQADDCDDCAATLDPDNPALTGYADISDGRSQFTYDVDASDIGATGVIVVTSTGRVNAVERTVRAELRKRTFLDYLYFTEYETLDPSAYPATGSRDQTWAAANCSRHRYDSPSRDDDCYDINWVTGDSVDGPFHTNDQLLVLGSPSWLGRATTSMADGTYYDAVANRSCRGRNNPSGCSSDPSFAQGLTFRSPMTLPPSNNQIKAEADPALSGEGCMYVGATFIRFLSDGSATIRSNRTDDPSASKCPTNGTMTSLPANGVIYVRSANASESCLSSAPHPYNLSADVTPYNNCAGDVFVEGTLDGRLTLAAENNIVISDHIRYAGGRGPGTDDMLGLVANNFVQIMHPINDGDQNLNYLPGGRRFDGPQIDAAILSVEHSFLVQNHNKGAPFDDPINVYGTIGQLYRGPVGTIGGSTITHGYAKDYEYDPRLEFVSPPHFLDPVQSAWVVRSVSEE
jgi:hypothetical protein